MAEQTAADGATDGLTCVREGAAGLVTLSRPEKRNALTIAARAKLAARLPEFARDPLVYAVVVRSAVDGIFCAGGDVVEMAALADRDMEAAEKALGDEIALVWRAECFTKPTVSLIDGAVIGRRQRDQPLRHPPRRRRALPLRDARDGPRPLPEQRPRPHLRADA